MRRLIVSALVALVVLNIADVVTTRMVLHSVRGVEQNPVSRALLRGDRVEIAKAVILAALALETWRRRATVGWACALWWAAGFYTLTVVNNGLVLWALR